jgi:hypothetical protein
MLAPVVAMGVGSDSGRSTPCRLDRCFAAVVVFASGAQSRAPGLPAAVTLAGVGGVTPGMSFDTRLDTLLGGRQNNAAAHCGTL